MTDTLRELLDDLAQEVDVHPDPAPPASEVWARARRARTASFVWRGLAAAACLLLVVGLGWSAVRGGYGSIVAGRSSFYVWRDNGCLNAALTNTCVLVADPSLAGLPVLAADALDQPLRTSLLGRHTGLAFWHWRISLTVLGALAALTTWHLVTRRRHP